VLDEIRAREGTITAICPFVADYLSRTTTYADLIDARYPGYSDRADETAAANSRTCASSSGPKSNLRVDPRGDRRASTSAGGALLRVE
jgi:hypothetical protein